MALMPTFQSILFQAKRSEPEALKCIYINYHPIIFRYVSRHVPYHMAEDVTSDIFLKMVADIYTLRADNEAEFKAWLFAITYTAIAAYHRRAERERVHIVPLDDAYSLSSPDDPTLPLLEAEKSTAVTGAISMLTTKRRKIVVGRAHGQDYKTLARTTGMKETTARSAHHRALLWMRNELAVQILVAIVVCSALIGTFLYSASRAEPGNPLYPIKQIFSGSPDSNPVPRYKPVAMPTIAPMPTVQPSPTPSPSPTTTNVAPRATPTTGPNRGIIGTVATALPITSSGGTPVTCVLSACVALP